MVDQHPTINAKQQSKPQLSQQKSLSFSEDLKTVQKVGWYVAALVTAGSLPAFVALVVSSSDRSLDLVGAIAILNFYGATFPLTTFAAIVGLVVVREWYKQNAYICFMLITFTLWVTTWLGLQWRTFPAGVDPLSSLHGSWLMYLIELLPVYWQTYGGLTFITCLVVGGFIAWAGGKMMWPYVVER